MKLNEVKNLLEMSDTVVILTGAGMSADLGIPTYWAGDEARYGAERSPYGYTDFEHAKSELWEVEPEIQAEFFANKARAFGQVDPLAPNSPYRTLRQWLQHTEKDAFVITSNPDNMFQRSGFDAARLYEIHGSYRRSQCLAQPQAHGVFDTAIHNGSLVCPTCGSLARPNVLFFQDTNMNKQVLGQQADAYRAFREHLGGKRVVALEIGAGNTVPTIKTMTLKLNSEHDVPVVRINPDRADVRTGMEGIYRRSKRAGFIQIPLGAQQGLSLLLRP
jgi:NAD-dependent SIR2 family protein deacetylase